MKPILLLFTFVLPFLVVMQRCGSPVSENKGNKKSLHTGATKADHANKEAQKKKLLQKKDKFFIPSIIRTDGRIAYLCNKKKFTDKIFPFLENEKINSDIFIVLRDSNSVKAPENLNKYDLLFQKASKETISGNYLKPIIFVESYGRTDICSGSGAYGIAQFMPTTGAEYGLVKYKEVKVIKNGKTTYKKVKVYDHRNNPYLSLLAATRYLEKGDKIFGRPDFTVVSYHAGNGNVYKVIELYLKQFHNLDIDVSSKNAREIIEKYNLSWSKIYFAARPGTRLYKKFTSMADRSASYYFRAMTAHKMLGMTPEEFSDFYKATRNNIDENVIAPKRYYTWYKKQGIGDEIGYINEKIKSGEFVKIPKAASAGLLKVKIPNIKDKARLLDGQGLGLPAQAGIKNMLYYTSPEVAGASLLVVSLFRKSFKKYFETILVISLVRPDSLDLYSYEHEDLPLHVIGCAFDIAMPAKAEANERLRFILTRLEELSWLSFKKNGKSYHVVISPNKEPRRIFRKVYRESLKFH